MRLRSAGLYVLARRVGENRMFSPTQSFRRLSDSSLGRTALPPSQPHAATNPAAPPAAASLMNPRRSVVGDDASMPLCLSPCASVMTRKPPAVPPGDHRAQRGGVHEEHQ